jgi:hypothetical protein
VSGRVLRCVREVKVSHLFVPFRCSRAAQVRPWNERAVASQHELRLEGVGQIWLTFLLRNGCAVVHQEHRDGTRPLGKMTSKVLRGDGALDHVQLQTAGAGHIMHYGIARPGERYGHGAVPRTTLPDRHGLSVGPFDFSLVVVPPANADADRLRRFRHEEAQSH